MDSEVNLYLSRAEDEFLLSQKDMDLSTDLKTKETLGISLEKTFFYSVISHAYYSIFYTAKAYLLSKGIKTKAPNEHQKTYRKFRFFVVQGILDKELLKIYESEISKAEALLNIFFLKKSKRGRFTYNLKSEANLPYAKESVENARKFVSLIKAVLENEEIRKKEELKKRLQEESAKEKEKLKEKEEEKKKEKKENKEN